MKDEADDNPLDELDFPKHFFLTPESECSYLQGQNTAFVVPHVPKGYRLGQKATDRLAHLGFRRSGIFSYLPLCPKCRQCRSVRVEVDKFSLNRNFNRILKKNIDLEYNVLDLRYQEEHYQLFIKYLVDRHKDGEMAEMSASEYRKSMLSSTCTTKLIEHKDPAGKVVIVSITDFFSDGISAHYTFYDPNRIKASPGTFAILTQINLAKKMKLPYVYLGFWIKDCPNMSYKANFQPLEVYDVDSSSWLSFSSFKGESS